MFKINVDPDQTPGLHCLQVSLKWDTTHKGINGTPQPLYITIDGVCCINRVN